MLRRIDTPTPMAWPERPRPTPETQRAPLPPPPLPPACPPDKPLAEGLMLTSFAAGIATIGATMIGVQLVVICGSVALGAALLSRLADR